MQKASLTNEFTIGSQASVESVMLSTVQNLFIIVKKGQFIQSYITFSFMSIHTKYLRSCHSGCCNIFDMIGRKTWNRLWFCTGKQKQTPVCWIWPLKFCWLQQNLRSNCKTFLEKGSKHALCTKIEGKNVTFTTWD